LLGLKAHLDLYNDGDKVRLWLTQKLLWGAGAVRRLCGAGLTTLQGSAF